MGPVAGMLCETLSQPSRKAMFPGFMNGDSPSSGSARGIQAVVDGLAEYLRYHKEIGEEEIEVDAAVTIRAAPTGPALQPNRKPPPAMQPAEALSAAENPPETLEQIAGRIANCTACALCDGRTKTVPGQGATAPEILFVGEGPGADEDRQGRAFVGLAGKLLTRMSGAMGFRREDVFIANVVKCRPPGNRNPHPDEMATCMPYLEEQIKILKPKVIVALGAIALKGLLDKERLSITGLRGRGHQFNGIDLMPTFHPAYLLRNPDAKRDVWNDLKEVLARIGREPPG